MKFSIVTPSFRMERWISRTIESIISQEGDFEIEYILADGASPDRTVALFEDYRKRIEDGSWPLRCKKITMSSFSEKDNGTFDAINKGMSRATGDIVTWADADNTLEPGALAAIAKTFEAFPDTQWVSAAGNTMNEQWEKTAYGMCFFYYQPWLQAGVYGREAYFVAQHGCFWRRELMSKIPPIPTSFRVAGDYWLWMQLAKYAAPLALNVHVANFMKREGQLHTSGGYRKEQEGTRPHRGAHALLAKAFFFPYYHGPKKFQPLLERLYPILFPFQSLAYVEIQNGTPIKKRMSSFFVR